MILSFQLVTRNSQLVTRNSCFNISHFIVYPYEYFDDWEKISETWLPEKEDFYSHLRLDDITNSDYAHAKRVCKDFEIKNLGEYYDLYVQSNKLLLADVIYELYEIYEIYELDAEKLLSTPMLV